MAFSVLDTLNQNSKAGADETPKARFRTKDVSVFKMYRNDMNFYALNEIEGLAADIFMFGLKQNLEVVYDPCDKGEYRIVSGERRWMALKHLVSKGHKQFEFATCKITIPVVRQIKRCSIKRFNSYCFHSCWMFRSFYPIPFWQFILRTQWLRQINCRSHQGTIQVHNH